MLYDRTLIVGQYQARSNEDCSGVASYRKEKGSFNREWGARQMYDAPVLILVMCCVIVTYSMIPWEGKLGELRVPYFPSDIGSEYSEG